VPKPLSTALLKLNRESMYLYILLDWAVVFLMSAHGEPKEIRIKDSLELSQAIGELGFTHLKDPGNVLVPCRHFGRTGRLLKLRSN